MRVTNVVAATELEKIMKALANDVRESLGVAQRTEQAGWLTDGADAKALLVTQFLGLLVELTQDDTLTALGRKHRAEITADALEIEAIAERDAR